MSDHDVHPGDALQLLLDDRLSAGQRAGVEAHLRECGRCRQELEALRRVKATLRDGLPRYPAPPDLAARISAALAEESRAAPPRRRRGAVIGWFLAAAAVLALIVVTRSGPDFISAAADDFAAFQDGRLSLDRETADPTALEQFFADERVVFPTRVFDYGMMRYNLAGGSVRRLAGRTSVLFAYRDADGRSIVCQMYEGETAELPVAAEIWEHDEIEFHVYRRGSVTLVFWQEGDVVCVLVADAPLEEAVELAYAKAVRV